MWFVRRAVNMVVRPSAEWRVVATEPRATLAACIGYDVLLVLCAEVVTFAKLYWKTDRIDLAALTSGLHFVVNLAGTIPHIAAIAVVSRFFTMRRDLASIAGWQVFSSTVGVADTLYSAMPKPLGLLFSVALVVRILYTQYVGSVPALDVAEKEVLRFNFVAVIALLCVSAVINLPLISLETRILSACGVHA